MRMNEDERYLLIASLLSDGWDLHIEDDYSVITNPEGMQKRLIYTGTSDDDVASYVIDDKALYVQRDSDQEMEMLIPFIYQCFDGLPRI